MNHRTARKRAKRFPLGVAISALIFLATALVALFACRRVVEEPEVTITRGDPKTGKIAIRRYGCGTCHVIPGIDGAHGMVGPSLDGVGTRTYLAGTLPNTPQHMIRWIQTPQQVNPRKIMPDLGVTEADARDIAAYLYTLGKKSKLR